MRICLLAWGSRGDVQPLVALGRGLRTAGYEVSVAAGRDFTPTITAAGLTADPFDIDIAEATQSDLGRRWLEGSSGGIRQESRLMREVVESFAPIAADGLARMVDCYDVFVSGLLTMDPMLSIARATGRRHILAALAPSAPTRSGRASLYPVRPDADTWINLAAGYLGAAGAHRVLRPVGDATRARLGLPRQGFRRYVREAQGTPVLHGVSPHVVPPATDTAARVTTTGYWVDPPDPAYTPPDQLAAFLADGPAPVYLGFGSMPTRDPDALFTTMTEALTRIGRRGIVHGNWDGWRPGRTPDGILMVDAVPHDWLFPRAAAVVHHGGSGTTGSAVRSGVPQLVVPHMGDQPYWGRRVAELGVAVPPIRRHDLSTDRLAAALAVLVTDDPMAARARDLGERVRAEDGVARAVEATQRLLA